MAADSAEFHRFMEATRLTNENVAEFIARSKQFEPATGGLSIFDQANGEIALPTVDDRVQRLLAARRSVREFDDQPLSLDAVAEVFAAVGQGNDGRPLVASAGGLDPVELYAVARRCEAPLDASVVHYQASTHSASRLGPAPEDDELRRLFGLDIATMPQLLLVFVVDPSPTLEKYGERGGRFLMQSAGLAMANVGVRLAASERRRRRGMHGYVLGGVLDEVIDVIGLGHTRAFIVGGYAVGR